MSDSIQNLTRQIFRSFGFHLDKNPERGSQQIQEVLKSSLKSPIVTVSTTSPSLAAVGAAPRPKTVDQSARDYAVQLHRAIYNKPVGSDKASVRMQQRRIDLAKYLLAGALLFSKLQEGPADCKKVLSALSKTPLSAEADIQGYENFGFTFGHFFSFSNQDRMTKFEQLRTGAKKEGENSCQEFGRSFHTSPVRQTWSQNFAVMMKCFESDAEVLSCLEKK